MIPTKTIRYKKSLREVKTETIFFFSYTINSSERHDYVSGLVRQDMRVQTAMSE
jgi:hypothetical protein